MLTANQLNNALTLFFSLMVEAIPFLLLGVLFSSALLLFVDERKLVAAVPRHPLLAALAGSLIGCLFPVCECGNVPVARRLIVQGAPSSMAIGFLLAAPTVNPIVFWATWTAFRDQPEVVFLRVGFTLLIASIVGWVFSTQADLRPLLQPTVTRAMPSQSTQARSSSTRSHGNGATTDSDLALLQSGTFLLGTGTQPQRLDDPAMLSTNLALSRPWTDRLPLMLDNVVQELRELGGVLILGAAIASIIQIAAPREVILGLGQNTITSILAMMLLACVVSICSTVDSFFALSFASTFTTGSLLAFLVFGPMIDLKNIALLWSVFRARAIIYLFVLAAQLTFLLSLLVNLYI
ncbi:permease [Thermocoleostomius sinensis]|uniref:Permease n=1 Tax=Thermocoleostomius sinensis A174 TaxID=2016057 RepID=A0A9E8ZIN7_9CYAN|nr:permease [Thermocoleostomius sinensis]WAL61965.1 permease [Thermocoleostomius sinensis A174]